MEATLGTATSRYASAEDYKPSDEMDNLSGLPNDYQMEVLKELPQAQGQTKRHLPIPNRVYASMDQTLIGDLRKYPSPERDFVADVFSVALFPWGDVEIPSISICQMQIAGMRICPVELCRMF